MRVSELFYSLQGEGARAGEASIFLRLSGCSAKFACAKAGIVCDTEFESGRNMSLEQIEEWCREHAPQCRWIIWTGGEPTDQLTSEIVSYFKHRGFLQAIETSGVRPVPAGLDYVTVSPKVGEHILKKHFPEGVDELRYVRHAGQDIPQPSIAARAQFVSPHSDGLTINLENLRHCVSLCREHPGWRLSVQQHKMWGAL
jgi:organic radical activating enzyme